MPPDALDVDGNPIAGFLTPAPARREVPSPAVTITALDDTNSILVRGTQTQLAEIGQLIHALDVRRPHVMTETAIVEVSGDVAEQLGAQLGFGVTKARGRTSPSP